MARWLLASFVALMQCGTGPVSCAPIARVLERHRDLRWVCIHSLQMWQPPCLVSGLLRRTLLGGGNGGCWLNWR
eukprot:5091262-Amphidinium_carterae.1